MKIYNIFWLKYDNNGEANLIWGKGSGTQRASVTAEWLYQVGIAQVDSE